MSDWRPRILVERLLIVARGACGAGPRLGGEVLADYGVSPALFTAGDGRAARVVGLDLAERAVPEDSDRTMTRCSIYRRGEHDGGKRVADRRQG